MRGRGAATARPRRAILTAALLNTLEPPLPVPMTARNFGCRHLQEGPGRVRGERRLPTRDPVPDGTADRPRQPRDSDGEEVPARAERRRNVSAAGQGEALVR